MTKNKDPGNCSQIQKKDNPTLRRVLKFDPRFVSSKPSTSQLV